MQIKIVVGKGQYEIVFEVGKIYLVNHKTGHTGEAMEIKEERILELIEEEFKRI